MPFYAFSQVSAPNPPGGWWHHHEAAPSPPLAPFRSRGGAGGKDRRRWEGGPDRRDFD